MTVNTPSHNEDIELPLLDARLFLSGTQDERKEFAQAFTNSLLEHGFARVINHGLDETTVGELFDWSRKFFQLPDKVKQKIEHKPGPNPQRGWSAVGSESTAKLFGRLNGNPDGRKISETDAKEHFDQGPLDDLAFPNRWPSEDALPGFRPFLEHFYTRSHEISMHLLTALEEGLDLPAGAFTDRCKSTADELRLNHYPELQIPSDKAQTGANRVWLHTDLGIITCLFQDNIGGLEMEDRRSQAAAKQRFQPIPPGARRDEMVVNISETMERWTNGVLKAGKHLVMTPKREDVTTGNVTIPERFSIPYFVKASRETSVGPLPYFVSDNAPPVYPDMTALEFHAQRVAKAY
ncbi:hypothetical protein QBC37DRAFT_382429 [Rhypophila decipiens]|uniref:Fe2OG dioxygenase domain-containing protein n=1 Tax=Rhypophila decipiens TaxID=261697 RepID=A0AAN6YKD7_9PEZI|nr:hypothetical protein QBC37DRAFT_382429 [Rhypophila decipiens]